MTNFFWSVYQLDTAPTLDSLVDVVITVHYGRTATEELTQENYDRWCHGYIFDAMKDQRFGQAFCNHFGITDNHVFYERDVEKCKVMIRKRYL